MEATDLDDARSVLRALIEGRDPVTGNDVAENSPLHHVKVVRALLKANDALKNQTRRSLRRAAMPENVGKPWSDEETSQAVTAAQAGEPIPAIAKRLGRTERAIQARLHGQGVIAVPAGSLLLEKGKTEGAAENHEAN